MKFLINEIINSSQKFWVRNKTGEVKEMISDKQQLDVWSGRSVAIYQLDEVSGCELQIAQLMIPDYDRLKEKYINGTSICLDYTYIDEFTWLGEKQIGKLIDLPYFERETFSFKYSFLDGSKRSDEVVEFINIAHNRILETYFDLSHSFFYKIKLNLFDLEVVKGNIIFDNSCFFDSHISFGQILCGGDSYFAPEISFRYTNLQNSEIDTLLMAQELSMDFLKLEGIKTSISLDPSPSTFKDICFNMAKVDEVSITNATINELDIKNVNINRLTLLRCKFEGNSEITGNIIDVFVDDCINFNVFKIALPNIKKIRFNGTINSGRFHFLYFANIIEAIFNFEKNDNIDEAQLLMLKENFRLTGEYENEDICHLKYNRLKRTNQRNIPKKIWGLIIDVTSGYGTKPCRMLVAILLLIILFGSAYYFLSCFSYHGIESWLEHVYASGITFFAVGYGDLYPLNIITKIVSLLEAFLGVSMTSYFLVLLSRKIIR